MEQPRRKKKEEGLTNRRMNAIKHHHPAVFKDPFGNAKLGKRTNRATFHREAEGRNEHREETSR